MRTIDEIKNELIEHQRKLDNAPIGVGNADALADYLGVLNNIASRTTFMIAEATKIRDAARASIQDKFSEMLAKMSPSARKDYEKAHTSDENALHEWVVSMNETAATQSKNIITMLSYEKQQIELNRKGY